MKRGFNVQQILRCGECIYWQKRISFQCPNTYGVCTNVEVNRERKKSMRKGLLQRRLNSFACEIPYNNLNAIRMSVTI